MAVKTVIEAIRDGMDEEMARDESVFLIGEDVGNRGGVFLASDGLYKKYGELRVIDSPLAESCIVGVAIGAAVNGMRPIAEIQFADFIAPAMNQIIEEAARFSYRTAGDFNLPLVIRAPWGGGVHGALYHSQSIEAMFAHVPGLKVVAPGTPADAKGLLAAAIRDPDPVVFFEHKSLYPTKGQVPEGEHVEELGRAMVRRAGEDATIVALASMVPRALDAAERLSASGMDAEVIDVRSLVPLDMTTIGGSVAKTSRLFTVEENPRLCGWGAEVASIIAEELFDDLDGPIVRITTPHVPLPAADGLEDAVVPSVGRIVD